RQVDAERRGRDQKKNRLLQSILGDTAVDLCRDIFFAQSGVNGLGEKAIISDRYDSGKQGKNSDRICLESESKATADLCIARIAWPKQIDSGYGDNHRGDTTGGADCDGFLITCHDDHFRIFAGWRLLTLDVFPEL